GLLKAENIRLVMLRNCIDKAIYVGDAQGDYDSSKVAKIPFVYASYGFGKVADYEYSIASFDKLPEIVGKIL
ncbi:MAG: HAD family hydrolase, partial [Acutalibacteraceae bacterium]